MLSVLICDDEINICTLIKHLIRWDELEMRLVDIVYSGQDAYQAIHDYHPDIVITDIRMPDLDGLELIGKIKEEKLETQFIIISGYQHFEYVHDALRYGIADYLLKPINENELYNALNGIKNRIETKQQIQISQEAILKELTNARYQIEEHQTKEIYSAAILPDLEVLREENSRLKFSGDIFNAIILRYDVPLFEDFVSTNLETAIIKSVDYIRNNLPREIYDFICYKECNTIYCICDYDGNNQRKMEAFLQNILYTTRRLVGGINGAAVTIAVGQSVQRYADSEPDKSAFSV